MYLTKYAKGINDYLLACACIKISFDDDLIVDTAQQLDI
jgi:hypothetical protein